MKKEGRKHRERESDKEGGEKEIDYCKWLFELSNKDVAIAGGKGASLAEMYNKKFPVPPAFIVTAQAFEKFIEGISKRISHILEKTDVDDTKKLNESSRKIRDLIEEQKMPKEMEEEIVESYEILGAEKRSVGMGKDALAILDTAKEPVFVAVRSSATTEDLAEASFAGQQETFLNIKGRIALLNAIKKCFSSLYTPRAIYYREKKGFKGVKALLSVVVQKMINSEKSGVMFTKNPIQDNDDIVIEAVFGLGEGIVSGRIKPDNYKVSKKIEILDKKIADKKKALVRNSSGETEEVKLTESKSKEQVLTDSEIERIADIGLKIEKHYKKPQDIEFAVENREIYIVQSRPITTIAKGKSKELEGEVLLTGLPASPGVASGKVRIVKSMKDLEKVEKGDVLVTEMTNPDTVVSMQKSDAIITDEGGATSHAAIVSREMGIPCLVGTKEATSLLKDGQIVTVDGASGKVYEGEVGEEKKKEILPVVETKTKIKVLVDLPDFAERAAKTKCREVGLLRLEGIIAESGKHPLMFLAEDRIKDYEKIIERGIKKIAKHFMGVWVRASDIRSDEFRNLQGSPKEIEVNPMLGFHGVRFSLKNKEILEAELGAIKSVADKFPDKKIGIMFPQIISVEETREVKKEFEKFKTGNMEFGVMVETPAACQIIEELCDEGLDFISFGTNDLTQYTLAVDRGNENVQDIYKETHPAVLRQMENVIKICKEKGVETSICGQAASKKEMVKFLVEKEIDSLSVNADAANEISKFVQELEKQREGKGAEKNAEDEVTGQEQGEVSGKLEDPEGLREVDKRIDELEKKLAQIGGTRIETEKVQQKEYPDVEIGVDVFNPEGKIAGSGEIVEEAGGKIIETIIGSIVTKPERTEQYPCLDVNLDFLKFPLQPPNPPNPLGPPGPSMPFPRPEQKQKIEIIRKDEAINTEEDQEIKEVVEEMKGMGEEGDIDIPELIQEEKDESVLDIF